MRIIKHAQALCSVLLVATSLALPVPTVAGQHSAYTIVPLIRPGKKTTDGGRVGVFFGQVGSRALNNTGSVTFYSVIDGGMCGGGIVTVSGAGLNTVAGGPCHNPSLGQLVEFFKPPSIDDQGDVVFSGRVVQGDGKQIQALLSASEGKVIAIAAEGGMAVDGSVFSAPGFFQFYGGFDGPAINGRGDIAFYAATTDNNGSRSFGIYKYSDGKIQRVVAAGDPAPIGGPFGGPLDLNPGRASLGINDNGDILFQSGITAGGEGPGGLFLATAGGVKKIFAVGDAVPGGPSFNLPSGGASLNSKGDVVFVPFAPSGIFLYSGGQFSAVVQTGDKTPIGGAFSIISSAFDIPDLPRLNDNGDIAFFARVHGGSSRSGIFVASSKGIVKAVAVGDRLPSGQKVISLGWSFSLNNLGQIAFEAFGKEQQSLGIFLAVPAQK